MKPVQIVGTTQKIFSQLSFFHNSSHICRQALRVYLEKKWPLWGKNYFVCWNMTWVSLWLLCNVHFVQSKQKTRLKDSSKVNVFCAISSPKVYGPFFFAEGSIIGTTYLDMLQLWLISQSQHILMFIFQEDGSPACFHCEVCQYLNTALPGCWVGRASGNYKPLMLWPPRSPDITPCDFFFFGDGSKTKYSFQYYHVTSLT